MANERMRTPLTRFSMRLQSLGIPFHGVRTVNSQPFIDFKPEATLAQRDQAFAALRAFDFTERELKSRQELFQEVRALSGMDRTAILDHIIADYLQANPERMAEVGLEAERPIR